MLQSGQLLDGRYKILDKLGEGAFGETYRASDEKRPSKPICVVKRLKVEQHANQIVETLFEKEAIVLEKLGEHPQIPRLLAHFMTNYGLFIVQEFIEGHPLNEEIKPGKPLSENYVIKLLQDILEILVFVHKNGVVHRDIKPANVMRRKDGKLILIDFGVVKELGSIAIDPNGVARTSVAAGTQGYMPFEQFKGKPGLYSDVYAVGMMAIEALTGIPPYHLPEDSETGEVVWRDRVQISDRLTAFLEKMVRDQYIQRYQTAVEALQALRQTVTSSDPRTNASGSSTQLSLQVPSKVVSSPPPVLQQFKFETAILVEKRGLFGLRTIWEIKREQGQAEFFVEDLGNRVTLEMVKIPGGMFLMGSPEDEPRRYDEFETQHKVTVPTFFMGKFEVTQEQYQEIMGKTPSFFPRRQRPVEQVSWNDAVTFCERLSQQTGRIYRLPSSAEWEYACRAGTTTPFYTGAVITTELANYNGTFHRGITYPSSQGANRQQTTDVGSFPPNAFGLYDMHGNVSEWCQDTWHTYCSDVPTDGSAWLKVGFNGSYTHRVVRGGSWSVGPQFCRSAHQGGNPVQGYFGVGFRVALGAETL